MGAVKTKEDKHTRLRYTVTDIVQKMFCIDCQTCTLYLTLELSGNRKTTFIHSQTETYVNDLIRCFH